MPLYFLNPNNDVTLFFFSKNYEFQGLFPSADHVRSQEVWKNVTQNVQENKLFGAMQVLINDSRKIMNAGQIVIGPHFPIFRFVSCILLTIFSEIFNSPVLISSVELLFATIWTSSIQLTGTVFQFASGAFFLAMTILRLLFIVPVAKSFFPSILSKFL